MKNSSFKNILIAVASIGIASTTISHAMPYLFDYANYKDNFRWMIFISLAHIIFHFHIISFVILKWTPVEFRFRDRVSMLVWSFISAAAPLLLLVPFIIFI